MRLLRVLVGVLLLLIAVPTLLLGTAAWYATQHRGADGVFHAGLQQVHQPGYALVVPDVDALLRRDAPFSRAGRTTLTITASGDRQLFVGLAAPADVVAVLGSAGYTRLDQVRLGMGPLEVVSTAVGGGAEPPAVLPPMQPIWLAAGTGRLSLDPSSWRGRVVALVVTSADGRQVGDVRLAAALNPHWLNPTAWGLLGIGSILLLLGIAALAWPIRPQPSVYVLGLASADGPAPDAARAAGEAAARGPQAVLIHQRSPADPAGGGPASALVGTPLSGSADDVRATTGSAGDSVAVEGSAAATRDAEQAAQPRGEHTPDPAERVPGSGQAAHGSGQAAPGDVADGTYPESFGDRSRLVVPPRLRVRALDAVPANLPYAGRRPPEGYANSDGAVPDLPAVDAPDRPSGYTSRITTAPPEATRTGTSASGAGRIETAPGTSRIETAASGAGVREVPDASAGSLAAQPGERGTSRPPSWPVDDRVRVTARAITVAAEDALEVPTAEYPSVAAPVRLTLRR